MKSLSFDPIRADVAITEKEKSAALHANALLHNCLLYTSDAADE